MSDEMRTPQYGHYQVQQRPEEHTSYAEEFSEKEKRKRTGSGRKNRRGGFGRKLAEAVVLAGVFGVVAGLAFRAVNPPSEQNAASMGAVQTADALGVSDSSTPDIEEIISASAGNTVAGVSEAAMPSVVAITSVSIQEIPRFFGFGYGYGYQEYSSTGSGSGIIVGENDDELLIATNNHVVENATTLSVCFIGDDVVDAEEETTNLLTGDGDLNIENAVSASVKGTDEGNDLAVVAVKKADIPAETMNQIKIAQLGNSDNLIVGEQVVAIGNALGYGQSVTSGWISALDRSIAGDSGVSTGLIQTDAAINPGNSGGALLNMQGEVIGINSAKYADNAVEGMGYAIPISKAQPILEGLMEGVSEDAQPAYLGVSVADISTEAILMYNMPTGAFIYETEKGQAADAAGIQEGDIVVSMDGQNIGGKNDFWAVMQDYYAGQQVDIVLYRMDSGQYVKRSVPVTLGNRP